VPLCFPHLNSYFNSQARQQESAGLITDYGLVFQNCSRFCGRVNENRKPKWLFTVFDCDLQKDFASVRVIAVWARGPGPCFAALFGDAPQKNAGCELTEPPGNNTRDSCGRAFETTGYRSLASPSRVLK
jgi:hypothetical protein